MAGKNIPSKLKFLNAPRTFIPLNVNDIMGIVRSREQPIMSPFLMYGSVKPGMTMVLLPPTRKETLVKIHKNLKDTFNHASKLLFFFKEFHFQDVYKCKK